MVLLGPSGSGKTTALRILAGLEPLSDGHVWIGDRQVEDLPPRARDIAMVFQDYALYPQMSVYENMAFGLKVKRLPKDEIRARVKDAADVLGISELLKRKPAALSGGQRQRVALGRALVRDPEVFLMDEPLSNLDAKLRAQTRGEIRRLQKQRANTTIYLTHDQVEAMTMGDRVAILHNGRLEQVGDAHKVYEEPTNAFVAGFLGSPAMAFGEFGVRTGASGVELISGTICLAIQGDLPRRSDDGTGPSVLVGVRPEDARPWDSASDLIGPLEGRVESVEALGRETFIEVRANDQLCFTAQVPGEQRIELGDAFQFGLKRGKVHLFSATEGFALGKV
jgi:ABC-type sugar transport system ATPase subunit